MSADVDELPIFCVEGPNWICFVKLTEDDFSYCSLVNNKFKEQNYSLQEICLESATLSIERLFPLFRPEDKGKVDDRFGIDNGVEFEIMDNNSPNLGTLLCVYEKDKEAKENNCTYIPTWEALANAGYYEMAKEAFKEYQKDKKIIEQALKDVNKEDKSKKPKNRRKK